MSGKKIVVLDSFAADGGAQSGPLAWPALRALGDVSFYPRTPTKDIVSRCAGAHIVVTNKARMSAELISALPTLEYIGVSATGTNVVDIGAAQRRNVVVTNVPGYAGPAVAQHTFAMLLHLMMDVAGHDKEVEGWGLVRPV